MATRCRLGLASKLQRRAICTPTTELRRHQRLRFYAIFLVAGRCKLWWGVPVPSICPLRLWMWSKTNETVYTALTPSPPGDSVRAPSAPSTLRPAVGSAPGAARTRPMAPRDRGSIRKVALSGK